ncbi:unnamed protein product [Ostreobium quekettii]|uniref:Uncharacterized protein n=1 Tax=Ostreobium quekettii TaxID=121088 RepID=A0A8S1J7L7_9CHLO|nr:unnamed protein product [Ostreobium quekettii]
MHYGTYERHADTGSTAFMAAMAEMGLMGFVHTSHDRLTWPETTTSRMRRLWNGDYWSSLVHLVVRGGKLTSDAQTTDAEMERWEEWPAWRPAFVSVNIG